MIDIKRLVRNHLMALLLGVLLLGEVVTVAFFLAPQSILIEERPLKISEIDGPRIDAVAAMTGPEAVGDARPAPEIFLALLLLIYGTLLVFNFSCTFAATLHPRWAWEAFYTILTLFAWHFLDPGRQAWWFPLAVVKVGLILFAFYVYALEKKRLRIDSSMIQADAEKKRTPHGE